jgi:nucleotide-binding universal stress UspA family protein
MNILVAYDGSTCADAAIEDMRRAGLPEDAETLVVCVADGRLHPVYTTGVVEADVQGSWREKLAEAEALVKIASDRIKSYFPRWTVLPEALWGSPAKIILETSAWWHPDLLVAGSHGRSRVARLFLGSVSAELIHKAACSVRVARTGRSCGLEPIRIIIGNDGSTEAEAVIQAVARRLWPEKTEAYISSWMTSWRHMRGNTRPFVTNRQTGLRFNCVPARYANVLTLALQVPAHNGRRGFDGKCKEYENENRCADSDGRDAGAEMGCQRDA